MAKPVFIYVPGAACTPKFWSKVIAGMEVHGYTGTAIPLPSVIVDGSPATYDLSEDVAAIRNAVRKLVEEQGKDVVVVAHCYGGLPASEALSGLGKKERQAEGLQGGVTRIVYIAAVVFCEDTANACGDRGDTRGDISQFWSCLKLDLQAGTVSILPEDAVCLFFGDLPEREAYEWASELRPHSIGVFWSTVKSEDAAWRYIPSTYVFCKLDEAVLLSTSLPMLAEARVIEPGSFDTVEYIQAAHFPMLSRVEDILRILRKAAGEAAQPAAQTLASATRS